MRPFNGYTLNVFHPRGQLCGTNATGSMKIWFDSQTQKRLPLTGYVIVIVHPGTGDRDSPHGDTFLADWLSPLTNHA